MLLKISKAVACFGSAAVIISAQKLQAKDLIACHDCHMKRLPKADELPLYRKDEDFDIKYDEKSTLPLISEISTVRKKVFQYATYAHMFQEKTVHIYETGVAHSKGTFDYLKDEENIIQRGLIIASGGLLGLISARKGGIFKKILYSSLGTGIVFSIFYPSISKEYAQIGWETATFHINNALTNYGGYDTDKLAAETNEKIEYIKSAMKFEGLMNKLNEMFYRKKDPDSKKSGDDIVSSNKESTQSDQDMYTTRTAE